MKPRKPTEPDADYIRRLEVANRSLREDNKRLKQWASNLDKAVSVLATDASLAFQAMAEKAGVRFHPSVRAVIKMLDSLVGMYCHEPDAPKIEFPKDWDLDPPEALSGDADMQLNSPIARAIELLNLFATKNHGNEELVKDIFRTIGQLDRVLQKGIEGVKRREGYERTPPPPRPEIKNYCDMTRKELTDMLSYLSWWALDLAQDMDFTNEFLRRDLRASAYRRIRDELYRMAYESTNSTERNVVVKVLGAESPQ